MNDTKGKPAGGAHVIENAATVVGNKEFAKAKEKLDKTFDAKRPRVVDAIADDFLAHHVFSRDEETGSIKLIFPAGCYVSRIEKDLINKLMEDKELQAEGNKMYEDSGFITEAEEPLVEAKVLR